MAPLRSLAMTHVAGTLSRLPLRSRLLLAPLLGVVLLGALLAAFIYESQRQNALLMEVAEHRLAIFDRYSDIFVDLSTQHVALYQLLTDAPGLDERSYHLQAKLHLEAVHAAIDKFEGVVGADADHGNDEFFLLHRNLLMLTQAYRRTVAAAVETKTANRAQASSNVARANERFAAMNRAFSRLLDIQRQGLVDDITAGVDRNRSRGLMLASSAIVGAILLLAFSVTLTQVLARSLRAQIAALAELSEPGTDARRVDGDEVQSISRAIAMFRNTQAALRASEQRFRLFFEHNNAVILLIDPDNGAIRDANESASRFYGYPRAKLCSMAIQQINQLPPEEVARERENAKRELRNYFIFPHRLADGRVRSVEVHATPVEVGGKMHLFSIVHDVTERKNAEEELRLLNRDLEQRIAERTLALWNEKSLLRTLIDTLPDVVAVKDKAGRYLVCNRAFARSIAGRQEPEVIGRRSCSLLPADQAAYFEDIARLVMATGVPHKEERVVRFADGRDMLLEVIETPFYDHDNRIIGTIGIGHDVTERHRREQSLREAQAAADAANRAKSAFLAAMSHEIRTPMHGVVGMIELMGETARGGKQKRMVETARNSAFALLRIIDDILDFSKIEAGKLTIERIPVSIQEIVESVANTLAPIAVKAGIRLLLHYDPALPPAIFGDQVRLAQILLNLANNAIKFSGSVEGAPAQVLIRIERHGGDSEPERLRIVVRDHGIGMTPGQVEELFQPFSQADVSTTRRFGGTGLGLTICKRLVDQMDGTIVVDSAPGAGSTFVVDLPLEAATPATVQAPPPDLAGVRVLALVDMPEMEEAVAATLRAAGVETTFCADLESLTAQEQAARQAGRRFDALLLRLDDREDAARELMLPLERQPEWARMTRIMLRANLDFGVQAEGLHTLAIRCYPLLPSTLLQAVAKASGHRDECAGTSIEIGDMPPAPAQTIAKAEADGRLVLVAEDNEINRDVIARQLEVLGYAAIIVDGGRAALEASRARRFGLLLTDCHMPEMDGFQLTQAIRQQERTSGHRLPIVAITANAMRGEVRRCLASGMDDFLSKPFELRELQRILARWLPRRETPTPMPAAASAAPASAPVDFGVLTKLIGDDPDIQARLLDKFLATSEGMLADLRAAASAGRFKDVAAAAHKLKSSCRSIGSAATGDVSAALEAAGEAGDASEVALQLGQLDGMLHDVFGYLRALKADGYRDAARQHPTDEMQTENRGGDRTWIRA